MDIRALAMADLILNVKGMYFAQIRDLTKPLEFRLCTPRWHKRLHDKNGQPRHFDRVVVVWGYPKRDDMEKRLFRPWRGFEVQTVTHEHFGKMPVDVFAIRVND